MFLKPFYTLEVFNNISSKKILIYLGAELRFFRIKLNLIILSIRIKQNLNLKIQR